jgi:hypothetical protein
MPRFLCFFDYLQFSGVLHRPPVTKRVKDEALHLRMVAGSAEGGPERLGAHREVQENCW